MIALLISALRHHLSIFFPSLIIEYYYCLLRFVCQFWRFQFHHTHAKCTADAYVKSLNRLQRALRIPHASVVYIDICTYVHVWCRSTSRIRNIFCVGMTVLLALSTSCCFFSLPHSVKLLILLLLHCCCYYYFTFFCIFAVFLLSSSRQFCMHVLRCKTRRFILIFWDFFFSHFVFVFGLFFSFLLYFSFRLIFSVFSFRH